MTQKNDKTLEFLASFTKSLILERFPWYLLKCCKTYVYVAQSLFEFIKNVSVFHTKYFEDYFT